MIIILLTIIACAEILRLLLTHWPVYEKKHFKQKLQGVQKMICDLSFKTFKTQEIREGIRKEYDTAKSRKSSLEEEIKNWPKEKTEADRKGLEDKVVLFDRDIMRFEQQLKQLDLETNGSKPTNEYPDGIAGIKQQIDSLMELRQMIKEWIKSL